MTWMMTILTKRVGGETEKPSPPPSVQPPFVKTNGETGDGVSVGGKTHGYLETCYNANKLFHATYLEGGKARSRMFRRSGPWDETRICAELLKDGVLNDKARLGATGSPRCDCYDDEIEKFGIEGRRCASTFEVNVEGNGCVVHCDSTRYADLPGCAVDGSREWTTQNFQDECEKVLGFVCRGQCVTLARLFDVWDFRIYPPRMTFRKTDVTLRECVSCLQFSDCSQRPLLMGATQSTTIDWTSWGTGIQNTLIPPRLPDGR